jgi:hypothetical protein
VPRHSARRFLLEVLFLAGVAAALTYAELRPAAVIALMAIAWVVVALLEWTAWLDEPHYGRGLPPRYYVPHVALPPPRAVEQGEPAYPILPAYDDEPTFVASTQEWAAGLAEWPEPGTSATGEDTVVAMPPVEEDRGDVTVVPLPPPIPEVEETVAAELVVPEEDEERAPDEPHVVEVVGAAAIVATVAEPEAAPAPSRKRVRKPEPEQAPVLVPPARVSGTALHHVAPPASTARRRFRLRRGGDEAAAVEVVDGPPPDRVLPSRVLEETAKKRR